MANPVWTDSQKEFLRQNADRLKDWEIAAALSRVTGRTFTMCSVRQQRQRLGIRKKQGRGLCEVVSRPDPRDQVGLATVGSPGPFPFPA